MTGADRPHGRERVRTPWSRSDRPVPRRLIQPLQSFLEQEAAGAILLLAAAFVALVWANSPWQDSYFDLWARELTIRIGPWELSESLGHWVKDGGMTLFFLVVGLEIKRELLTGDLRDPRAAALPAFAALGGMLVPAAIYVVVNLLANGDIRGWGVPMATDVAFALGVLTLAAARAPSNLKPFLLTLAIVDDIGAIIVIALFYSGGVTWGALGVATLLCIAILGLQRIHVRAAGVYVLLGIGVWIATFESGVHPTIAGVVLGLLTPAVPFQRPAAVSAEAHRIADETVDEPEPPDADAASWLGLAELSKEAVSPLARVENALHPWTSHLIVPLFALASAGVTLSLRMVGDALTDPVAIGILLGLVIGKPLGVLAAARLALALGVGRLPQGVSWAHMRGLAVDAGIGFTVSLFVAELAFDDPATIGASKLAILAASTLAGVGAILLLSRRGRPIR